MSAPASSASPCGPAGPRLLAGAAGRTLVVLSVVNLLNYLDRFVLSALVESIRRSELAPTDTQLGLLMTGFVVVYMVTAPIFGALGDRRARPPLIAAGVILWSLATGLAGLARSFGGLLAARAMVGIGESDDNLGLLESLPALLERWPRPVLLDPARVVQLGRDRLWKLLEDAPGLLIPPTLRLDSGRLRDLALGRTPLEEVLPGWGYPLIIRPVGSHAGRGLEKVDTPAALGACLNAAGPGAYYLSAFVDYRGADGFFRKYRVALVDGRPFICHMAVAPHWMLHYLNAGMTENPGRRIEEQLAFQTFDQGFARRQELGLRSLHERVGLEYFAIDCAESRDGRLLIFEADTAMGVHDMDPPELFPYKGPQMARIFRAFRELLARRAGA